MKKRLAILLAALAATATLAGGAAVAGGGGLIWDDGHASRPGTLDDGKELLPQTKISLAQALAAAQHARAGQLGQVDLANVGGRVVYVVDVGNQEVSIDAANGSVVGIDQQD